MCITPGLRASAAAAVVLAGGSVLVRPAPWWLWAAWAALTALAAWDARAEPA
jgi:hypothetical protein